MRGNRGRDTSPEIRVRSLVHRAGYRFRRDYPLTVAGFRVRPDMVFLGKRVAVFIDGCFWHGCPLHGRVPGANVEYWGPKLRRNAERDALQNQALDEAGWRVLRQWEHVPPAEAAAAVIGFLEEAGRIPRE